MSGFLGYEARYFHWGGVGGGMFFRTCSPLLAICGPAAGWEECGKYANWRLGSRSQAFSLSAELEAARPTTLALITPSPSTHLHLRFFRCRKYSYYWHNCVSHFSFKYAFYQRSHKNFFFAFPLLFTLPFITLLHILCLFLLLYFLFGIYCYDPLKGIRIQIKKTKLLRKS